MSGVAKESGHFYTKDGEPYYTIKGKNGIERPTTLRDARKLDLIPSVTTIIGQAAKPGLQLWKDTQLIMSCLTLPRLDDEDDDFYVARIRRDADEQAKKARERGTYIHYIVQTGFEGKPVPVEDARFYFSARDILTEVCGTQKWIAEESIAAATIDGEWYGGKIDLHSDRFLIDIKTTDKDMKGLKTWPEHAMQLAAYNSGLEDYLECGILFINTITAEARLIWLTDEQIDQGEECFFALLKFWYAKTRLGR